MHRFYCPSQEFCEDKIIISDRHQLHHLRDVLRLKVENEIVVFDGQGNEYSCIIEKIFPQVILRIQNRRLSLAKKDRMTITIACAIPKKSKFDDIVDKLTQLGVDRIIPLETERVVVKIDKHKKIARQKRWEKIALCASQQSQRSTLPIIEPIKNIREVLSETEGFGLKLIPTLTGERKSLKEIFGKSKAKNILVLIGPEGDFTCKEVALAKKLGCIPLTLGDLVLRVESAAVAVAAFIRLYADN